MNTNPTTAAHDEVTPAGLGMTDAELDDVSGGAVNPAMVLSSVMTLGIGCALASMFYAASQQDCGSAFHV